MTAALLVTLIGVASAPMTAQGTRFEPVTDEMLADPDPSDWLHWRRTLDGWGYSPLDQINRENAHLLQLVWSWSLPPGLSQPTPLVHDGVMFIPGALGVVQALDAATVSGGGSSGRRSRALRTRRFGAGCARWPSTGIGFMSRPPTHTW